MDYLEVLCFKNTSKFIQLEVPDFSSMSQEWQHHHQDGVLLHDQGEVDQPGLVGMIQEYLMCVCKMFIEVQNTQGGG